MTCSAPAIPLPADSAKPRRRLCIRRKDPPMKTETRPLFPLGRVVITANAQRQLPPDDVLTALRRHRAGDWGDLCEEDREANESALQHGERLFSVYHTAAPARTKFYLITEWDRSATTILLPEDY